MPFTAPAGCPLHAVQPHSSQLEEVGVDGRQVVGGGAQLGHSAAQGQHAALGRAQRQAVGLDRAAQRHNCEGAGRAGRSSREQAGGECRVSDCGRLQERAQAPANNQRQLGPHTSQRSWPRTFVGRHAHLALAAGGQEAAGGLQEVSVALLRVAGPRLGLPAARGGGVSRQREVNQVLGPAVPLRAGRRAGTTHRMGGVRPAYVRQPPAHTR